MGDEMSGSGMDLRTFIKEALVQVALGVSDAEAALTSTTAIVNPRNVSPATSTFPGLYGQHMKDDRDKRPQVVHLVEFDVVLSVTAGSEAKGGLGVVVRVLGIGGQRKTDTSSSSESRIKFSVP